MLAGVHLALAGSLTANEVGAAVLCGGLGAIWVGPIGRCGDHRFAIRAASLLPLPVAMAVAPAGYDLSCGHLPRALLKLGGAAARPFRLLDAAHSELIGDYVTWIVVGLAPLAGRVALA